MSGKGLVCLHRRDFAACIPETDYTVIVYDYLRALGVPGDEVLTAIPPWLEREHGLSYAEAAQARSIAMKEFKAQGKAEGLNTRSRYVRILS